MSVSQLKDARLVGCCFLDDLVLPVFSDSCHQQLVIGFAIACDMAEMKINNSKSEISSFYKSCLMFLPSWQSIIEAGGRVQVILGHIHAVMEGKTKNLMFGQAKQVCCDASFWIIQLS